MSALKITPSSALRAPQPLALRARAHGSRTTAFRCSKGLQVVAAYAARPIGVKPVPPGDGQGQGQYPDAQLIAETLQSFPDEGIADAEQTMALYVDGGYQFLDVRSPVELESEGSVGGAYNIPLFTAKFRFDSETKSKKAIQTANKDFLEQVRLTFPDKNAKILISCSDCKSRGIQALQLLDGEGYENIVGVKGGYNLFYAIFDSKFRRRYFPGPTTVWGAEGSTGFHATNMNKGFEKMDPGDEGFVAEDTQDWLNWSEEMKK